MIDSERQCQFEDITRSDVYGTVSANRPCFPVSDHLVDTAARIGQRPYCIAVRIPEEKRIVTAQRQVG